MEPYVIHIRMEAGPLARLQEEARRAGMAVYVVDLSNIADETALTSYLSDMFGFPHFIRGLDAVLDLLSDLDWIGNINGYLMVVKGAVDSSVGESFVSLFPNLHDRWRSREVPFVTAIEGGDETLVSILYTENRKLEEDGKLRAGALDIGGVDIVIHGNQYGLRPVDE